MHVKIQFLGAAGTVTGSKYLLTIDHTRILVDCGLFQGLKDLRLRNWQPLPVEAATIDIVLITHAHIDHIGYLPRLYREGFRGKVFCTHSTAELMQIMLLDSARLQEEEAEYAARKGYSKHNPPEPLYTTQNVSALLPHVHGHPFDTPVTLTPSVDIRFRYAGHILGAASIEMTLKGATETKRIVFSGDLGRYHNPVLHDPAQVQEADVLLIESTYGDKSNPVTDPAEQIARIVNETLARKGCVMIPAFAVGRSQTILYYLQRLEQAGKIPVLPVYLDSPMAIKVGDVYANHLSDHKLPLDHSDNDIFFLKKLYYAEKPQESKALNAIREGAVIVASSGMCEGGRILHHLFNRLPNPHDTLLLVGYQSEGTRGRRILDGEKEIKLFGQWVPVRCRVEYINGLSGHADLPELMQWLSSFAKSPQKIFIVHGEKETSEKFARTLREKLHWHPVIPNHLETFVLFDAI